MSLLKIEGQEGKKQVLSRSWYQWEAGGNKKNEQGGNSMYSCMKMEQ
jgi:hypothetical protein